MALTDRLETECGRFAPQTRPFSFAICRYIEKAFRDGTVKTTGTDIDKLMPPVSRFGGGNRAAKKQGIIEKIQAFFEKYFGLVGVDDADI